MVAGFFLFLLATIYAVLTDSKPTQRSKHLTNDQMDVLIGGDDGG